MNELCHAFLKFFEEGHNWWMKCYKGLFTDVLHRCKMQKWWMKLSLRLFKTWKMWRVAKVMLEWMNVHQQGYSNWTDKKKSPTADLKKKTPNVP